MLAANSPPSAALCSAELVFEVFESPGPEFDLLWPSCFNWAVAKAYDSLLIHADGMCRITCKSGCCGWHSHWLLKSVTQRIDTCWHVQNCLNLPCTEKLGTDSSAECWPALFPLCVFGEFLPRPGHWPTMHSAVAKGPYFFALFGFLLVSPAFSPDSLWVFEINHWMLKAKECLDSSHCFSMCISLSISVPVPSVRHRAPQEWSDEDCGDEVMKHLHQAAPRPQTEPRVEPARGATGTHGSTGLKSYQLFLSLVYFSYVRCWYS